MKKIRAIRAREVETLEKQRFPVAMLLSSLAIIIITVSVG